VRDMSDDVLFIVLFVWGISAFVAGLIATDRDRSFFGWAAVTFFFLGPLGPGFALVAPHGRIEKMQLKAAREADPLPGQPKQSNVAEGRQRFTCPRCHAQSDVPNADTSYECWQCGETRKVKPKVAKPAEG
jgi:DNA-directed RNA polymerase subunit RPC12/RpoP